MHHWTVSVSLNMRFETLMRVAPGDIKDLVTGSVPVLEALEMRHQDLSAFSRDKIHKSVSEPTTGVEINRKVHQII